MLFVNLVVPVKSADLFMTGPSDHWGAGLCLLICVSLVLFDLVIFNDQSGMFLYEHPIARSLHFSCMALGLGVADLSFLCTVWGANNCGGGPQESWSLCSNSSLRLYHMPSLCDPLWSIKRSEVRTRSDWVGEKLLVSIEYQVVKRMSCHVTVWPLP
jgi:hypothetical protein